MIEVDERYLRIPLNEYVQTFRCSGLEDPKIRDLYHSILWWLNECLLNKNLKDSISFKIVKFELCGSFADGTRIKEDELEFDLLAEVSTNIFSFKPSSTCPGYVHQVSDSSSNPQQISDAFIDLIYSHLPNCFSRETENDRVQLRFIADSPIKIIIDIHPVIITKVSDSSELHCVIPVSCKQQDHECWRISQFKTEMKILRNAKRHHILSFRVLKELRRVLLLYGVELYAKYALKTAVCIHECSCASSTDSDIKQCTLAILDILYNGYALGYLKSIVGMINIFNSIESNVYTREKTALYISDLMYTLREHFDDTRGTIHILREQLCQPQSPPVYATDTGHETSFSACSEISQNGLQANIPVIAQHTFEKMTNTATRTPVNTPEMTKHTADAPTMSANAANTPKIPLHLAITPQMIADSASALQSPTNSAISPTISTKVATSQNTVSMPPMLFDTSATPTWIPVNNAITPLPWSNGTSMVSEAASPWRPMNSSPAPNLPNITHNTHVNPVYDTTPYQMPSQFATGQQTPLYPSFTSYVPVHTVYGTFMPRFDMNNSYMPLPYTSAPGVVPFIPLNIGVVPQYCPTQQAPWFAGSVS